MNFIELIARQNKGLLLGMGIVLAVHILAGSIGLATGFVALYSAKGAPLHRKAGMAFVGAMLAMCALGGLIAGTRPAAPALNLPAALITAYLVITSLTTVRPPSRGAFGLQIGMMLVGLAVGLVALGFGFEALANGGTRRGMPAFPFFLFGLIGLLGSIGDVRMMRAGGIQGAPRITRHLWRMCLALLIAALSFFIGQAKVIPKPIRIYPLLALPMLAVLATMIYWLWRVRRRKGTLVTSQRTLS